VCFLGVGDNCDLAALYLDLAAHGHDVKVVIRNPVCRGILDGLVEKRPIGAKLWHGSRKQATPAS